jgi:hypothetical protein
MNVTRRILLFLAFDFFTTIVAGHGYDVGGSGRESDGETEIAGLTMTWILAAGGVALVTAVLLVWTSPETRARLARVRWKSVAPKAVIVLIIAAPLLAWTATSAGEDEKPKDLRVQRGTALTGDPELLVSLGEDDMNTLKTTAGKKFVRVVCVGRTREVVVDVRRKWPFVNELGFDYPHTHLVISRAQVQRAQQCRLRGTTVPLAAEVEGRLPR